MTLNFQKKKNKTIMNDSLIRPFEFPLCRVSVPSRSFRSSLVWPHHPVAVWVTLVPSFLAEREVLKTKSMHLKRPELLWQEVLHRWAANSWRKCNGWNWFNLIKRQPTSTTSQCMRTTTSETHKHVWMSHLTQWSKFHNDIKNTREEKKHYTF